MARRVAPGTGTLILDSEGLSKAASMDERTAAYVKTALREQGRVIVPAVTLAEVLRGGARDVLVHRALAHYEVVPITRQLGQAAGELLGIVGGNHTIDALVAAVARAQPGRVVVLTSDVANLTSLTEGSVDTVIVHV